MIGGDILVGGEISPLWEVCVVLRLRHHRADHRHLQSVDVCVWHSRIIHLE